jgi:hypothetical protein
VAEVRALLAPWLALFGQCLHLMGVHLAALQQTAADAAHARRDSNDQAAAADEEVGKAVADAHRTISNLRQLLANFMVCSGIGRAPAVQLLVAALLLAAAAAAAIGAAAAAAMGRVLCFKLALLLIQLLSSQMQAAFTAAWILMCLTHCL